MSGPAGFVYSYPITCPPSQRTFNSDGTRISEVGLKDWEHPERGRVAAGFEESSRAELESKRLNWRTDKASAGTIGDEASIRSGLSGDTLKESSAGEDGRRKSLVTRIFHRGDGNGEATKR